MLLPFAPYAGLTAASVSFPAPQIGPFESQILSAERKRLLAPSASSGRSDEVGAAQWR